MDVDFFLPDTGEYREFDGAGAWADNYNKRLPSIRLEFSEYGHS
jgi:hypothetical protein